MSSDIVSYLWEKHQAICPLKYEYEAQHAKYREKSVRVAKLRTIFRGETQNKKKYYDCSFSFTYFQMTPTEGIYFPLSPFL